jgi:release factor glutamine methyltransferase
MNVQWPGVQPGASIGALQASLPLDPLENRILLCHALDISRIALITQSERTINEAEAAKLAALVERRMHGEPIAYITGEREFYGLPFKVTPAVLIPRPDTELLVELAIERTPVRGRVLDMGTGSGAIAVSIAHSRPDAQVTALDVSADALQVARFNAEQNRTMVDFLQSDWYTAVAEQRFHVVASNPPYIADQDEHLSNGDLRFEPQGALTDFNDGLTCLRTIVGGAAAHLEPGGWLLMEHGYDQAAAVRQLLDQAGFSAVQSWRDLAGIERASGGQLPPL